MTPPILEIRGVSKSYGDVVALDRVDLNAGPGEVLGLLGPNGAGKTTLVSIVCGLRRADDGSVTVNGIDALAHPARAREHIGLAPQDLGVYPIDTVRQNLSLFGRLAGLAKRALVGEIETVATALRLSDLMDRKAAELSGGQKRRLHTAIALLNHPPLILLDEATAGADVETRSALIEVVRGLAARGSSIVYSTHYLQEVEALGARVVILDRGSVIAEGSVGQLVSANAGAFVELTFRGRPPALNGRWPVTVDGSVMRVAVDDPGRTVGAIFGSLGSETHRLQTVEFVSPSLETVFMGLTGRRFEREENADVLAS